ncbi:MAG: pyrimidine 5'-nucleotidase [Alphaproteobacteria bacterium]
MMTEDKEMLAQADWLFDLDNTLYRASAALFEQVSARINSFVADYLDLDSAAAYVVQKTLLREHGSTMRGLMTRHGVVPEVFMDFVHDIDYGVLESDERLGRALASLPGRKLVFTNASVPHAEAVLERLGIANAFEAIFDIAAADYLPKPSASAYDKIVTLYDLDPRNAVMVEDMARNLQPAAAMGMATVWIRGDLAWAVPEPDADYIHHEIDDLVSWLEALTGPALTEKRGTGHVRDR